MTPGLRNGLAVAALHIAIVGSLGAKLLVDRATRPRGWARVAPYDPNLPIRGRYVRLRLEAPLDPGAPGQGLVSLDVANQLVVAAPPSGANPQRAFVADRNGVRTATLAEPVAYFIPEHVADPSRRPAGEELWAEVTLPRKGAPRPIQLGVKKDGVLTPLQIR